MASRLASGSLRLWSDYWLVPTLTAHDPATTFVLESSGSTDYPVTVSGGVVVGGGAGRVASLVRPPSGGVASVGSPGVAAGWIRPPSGGALAGGTAPGSLGRTHGPSGGVVDGGGAVAAAGLSRPPSGVVATSGAAGWSSGLQRLTDGTIGSGGSAEASAGLQRPASGGAVPGGSSGGHVSLVVEPAGSVDLSGAADVDYQSGGGSVYDPEGGAVVVGSCDLIYGAFRPPSGGTLLQGSAARHMGTILSGSGGPSVAGTAPGVPGTGTTWTDPADRSEGDSALVRAVDTDGPYWVESDQAFELTASFTDDGDDWDPSSVKLYVIARERTVLSYPGDMERLSAGHYRASLPGWSGGGRVECLWSGDGSMGRWAVTVVPRTRQIWRSARAEVHREHGPVLTSYRIEFRREWLLRDGDGAVIGSEEETYDPDDVTVRVTTGMTSTDLAYGVDEEVDRVGVGHYRLRWIRTSRARVRWFADGLPVFRAV